MANQKQVKIAIHDGPCGPSLFVNGHKVAGYDPWPGKISRSWVVTVEDIQRALKRRKKSP